MKQSSIKVIRTLIGIAVLLILVFALVDCGGGGGGGYSAPTSTVQVVACLATADATVDAMGITSFSPASVTITVNQIVRWANATGQPHTVTSTTVPANGTFNQPLSSGSSVCLKFTVAGTYNYFCSIHPVMTGSVTVQ